MISAFAQVIVNVGPLVAGGIGGLLIAIVVVAACVGVVYVALRVFGVSIPDWVVQIFWIVVCAAVAIAAIRFLLSM